MFLRLVWSFQQGSTATCIHTLDQGNSPLLGMVVLFDPVRSLRRNTHGLVQEEEDTGLASQISQINPGDHGVTDVAARSLSHLKCVFFKFGSYLVICYAATEII